MPIKAISIERRTVVELNFGTELKRKDDINRKSNTPKVIPLDILGKSTPITPEIRQPIATKPTPRDPKVVKGLPKCTFPLIKMKFLMINEETYHKRA